MATTPSIQHQQYTLKNVLDINLTDDNIKLLAQLFNTYCHLPNVEIEAKLGFLVNIQRDGSVQRYTLPGIRTIVPLDNDSVSYKKPTFQSQIDLTMFQHLNERILNGKLAVEKHDNTHNITYKHIHQIDVFYEKHGKHIRVTRNKHTNQIIAKIEKQKLDNIDYFNPLNHTCDFRISANEENQCHDFDPNDPNAFVRRARYKDRLSYEFDIWSVDLTKVTTYTQQQLNDDGTVKATEINKGVDTYEVEMECINNDYVRHHANLHRNKQKNQMIQIATSLYNNIRTIAMFAFPTVPIPATCIPPQKQKVQQTQHAGVKRTAPTDCDKTDKSDNTNKKTNGDTEHKSIDIG